MAGYIDHTQELIFPRLALAGSLDLTYRCNNDCRHCWLRIPPNAPEGQQELTVDEIGHIVDQARAMGARQWALSGGEPMLRPDFAEIFDYITRKAITYSLNTNGTLITPRIAQLLRRRGNKMVALYGATAEVHDHITRNPGSFEATLRGMAYLREANAGFAVQLIPMKDNYHQWQQMIELAQRHSAHWRCGAPWLFLSASGSRLKNAEIAAQRLPPSEVVALDETNVSEEDWLIEMANPEGAACRSSVSDDRLIVGCIEKRHNFHIDPYGQMSFCSYIKDPALRYDLRNGSFQQAWEVFLPSLSDQVRGGEKWRQHCGSCEKRLDCRWCAAYSYLEHRDFATPISYLCQVADETRRYKQEWRSRHRRYFRIGGITIRIESDLPLAELTVSPALQPFEITAPDPGDPALKDMATIRHAFPIPDLTRADLGTRLYHKAPWSIWRNGSTFFYLGISPDAKEPDLHCLAISNENHTRLEVYHPESTKAKWLESGIYSLTSFPTDQILVARLLADRQGCILHGAGAILENQGVLFVGHSGAGKSTITRLLLGHAEILCDDRIIVRHWPEGFKIHGTWSHGDVSAVSPNAAPLKALLFLKKSSQNRLLPIEDRQSIVHRLLACLIKPLVTRDWWEKSLQLVEQIAKEVPCYEMCFDKSGKILSELRNVVNNGIR